MRRQAPRRADRQQVLGSADWLTGFNWDQFSVIFLTDDEKPANFNYSERAGI